MPARLRFSVSAPHRRFRSAVVAHGAGLSRRRRYKLRAAFIAGAVVAVNVQTPLVSPCNRVAAEPGGQDRGPQDDEPDPRTFSNHVSHISTPKKTLHTLTGLTTSEISDLRSSEVDCCRNFPRSALQCR